jgi:hypothetical protein
MTRSEKLALNLLDLKPGRNMEWEPGDGEAVVLLVPRFSGPVLGKWLQPHLRRPCVRVRLDEIGSFIWRLCDGSTPVSVIAEKMKERFGDRVEPLYERIELFIRKLQKDEFITIT